MKKIALLILSISFLMSYSQNNSKNTYNTDLLQTTLQVVKNPSSAIPTYISFKDGKEPRLNELSTILNSFSKNEFTLKEVNRMDDEIGISHIKYQQYINSIPLELSFVTAHLKKNKIISISGNLSSKHATTQTPGIDEQTALKSALNFVNAEKYKWELPEEEAFIQEETQDTEATFFPTGELNYFETKNELKLAYRFNIYAHKPISRADYYVEAITGKIIFKNAMIHHIDRAGIAATGYSGTQVITTDSTSSNNYRLRESGRGNGIETYDMNRGTTYGNAVDFTDTDNNWTSTTNGDHFALDAHWGAEMTYDYFWTVHARNSIDGNGFKLKSYVHFDNNYVNAFWDGNRMTYGDGNGTSTSPLTTMSIAGHEISHGLTSNTANLIYSYESGALNESFSDIFGTAIDFWSRPTLADWEMGDEIYINGNSYFRSMSNPNAKNDPDTYLGTYWYAGTGDNGGVHTNSGVQNYWFYLLVNGGSGTNDKGDTYSVTGVGLDSAARIAFRNLTVYLGRNSQYSDARFYSIKAATDLYGACSPAVIATTNAWHAVGVGPSYIAGVQSAFTTADSVGCKLPHTVSFTNTSNNATAFIWDFGDGNTSTAVNPTHTYTSGTSPWNVELYANGGACGEDTLLKITNVRIDTNLNCPTILGTNSIISSTDCEGTLYDDGGPSGNYSANQVSYFTITPSTGTGVTLNFTQFDIEPGSSSTNCNYDYIEVYDGTSTGAPLIGRYCNGNPPPSSISSSGASLLIKFRVDQRVENGGFQIDWNCKPFADFEINPSDLCINHQILPINKSGNASTYSWSMPGAVPASSSLANPNFSYAASGNYTVELIASNGSLSDTILKNITIIKNCVTVLPAGGTAPTRTDCSGKLLDDGGAIGDYSPNQTSYVTIAPTGASNVVLTFNNFDVELGTNCLYDNMKIYDGSNTAAPLIGKYCNSNVPPARIVTSGGAVTIEFYADQFEEGTGFDIDWSCSLSGIAENDKINNIEIYPNPSRDFITIEVEFNQLNELNIQIIDVLGKVQFQQKNNAKNLQFKNKIDVSNLANGTYIVYVNQQAFRFVKL